MDGEILARQLGDLGRQLDEATVKLAELDVLATGAAIEAARLKEEYEDRLAEGFLNASGSNADARKAEARLKASAARMVAQEASADAERARSAVRNQQQNIRTLSARIEVGRSLLSREKTLIMGLGGLWINFARVVKRLSQSRIFT
jgi:hypothetical protein